MRPQFGESLYTLQSRDLRTLLVDGWNQFSTRTIGAVGPSDTVIFTIPNDRILWIDRIAFVLFAETVTVWTQVQATWKRVSTDTDGINLFQRQNNSGLIPLAASAGGANVGGVFEMRDGIMCPPGGALSLSVTRTGTTNAVNWQAQAFGWLIPAANVGRLS